VLAVSLLCTMHVSEMRIFIASVEPLNSWMSMWQIVSSMSVNSVLNVIPPALF
jgi:hypothetical protein